MAKTIQFTRQLKKLMEHQGLNQKELAQLLDVSQPAISLYLRGRVPPAAILLKMATLGGTSIEWLLTGSSSPTTRVREKPSAYGMEQTLIYYWKKLNPETRSSLLFLMKQLVK